MIATANIRAKWLGKLNNSITNGKGNWIGFLGEELVTDFLGVQTSNTFDYDLEYDCWKIDVKTKECATEPQPQFDCSISDFNPDQKCDYYIFVRILNSNGYHSDPPNFTKAWILGIIPKSNFFEKAIKYKKGEIDKSNNFKFRCDTYNLSISKLESINEVLGL